MSRQSHCKKYFDETKKKISQVLWKGIHEIIYSKKSNKISISLSINSKTITNPAVLYSSNEMHYPSFEIRPTEPDEIMDAIKTLKSSRIFGPKSVFTKILKLLKNPTTILLSHLINKPLDSGKFANLSN